MSYPTNDHEYDNNALAWAAEVMSETKYRLAKEGAVASGRSLYLTATGWSLHFEGDHDKTVCGDDILRPASPHQVEAYAFCLSCYGIKYPTRKMT